ncbi:FABP family protein [Brooklawnia cerclae]|uniref:Ferric nitrobindin-like protein n=1 Tax=Brooklawnia cerclae TaxID=349934 RepID=A0ABX0SE66_9ACTN|nr:FABP family protein [Brooklawnia cerclae]NIH55613.1 hypothetical protein [Brooklawnia cerclae]
MAFEIPEDLNPALMGLAWLIGRWQGNGHRTWPASGGQGADEIEFGQQIDFATNGSGYLHYLSQTWTLDADGQPAGPLDMETGFWRPGADGKLEVVLASPEGWSEIWIGSVTGAKVELASDVVARTQTAQTAYTGGHRLYGNVEGHLMWAFDRATTEVELQPYMWARLQRA